MDGKREQIVAGVWQVILEQGIAGVSFRTVARAADVSVGLIQHYYGSKDLLIRASAAAMIDGSRARYDAVGGSGPEAIHHLVTHAIPVSARARDGVVIWHAYLAASVADDGLGDLLRAAKAGQEHALAEHLADQVGPSHARQTARILIAVADGLSARVITGEITGADALATATAATDTLLRR